MIEKVIKLEKISLVDFLGAENQNINEVADAFPKSKIISRGDEIKIKGKTPEILRINDIVQALILHYHKYGKITVENVKRVIENKEHREEENLEEEILVYGTGGIKIKPTTVNQQKLTKAVRENDLVFAIGPAGTGKTYISVALAVQALKNKDIKKIIITRPAVEAGENLGFLPGDLTEKIDPYLKPVYDALFEMIPGEKLNYYRDNGIIEIAPLAYMRGRTLNNAFILLDEAQNTTPMQIKMFLTRMGPNSKAIITGDHSQIDLPKNQKSGLVESLHILNGVEGIQFVFFDENDVVRHPLVRRIIKAYQQSDQ